MDDLAKDVDVVDTRRNPDPRLNSRVLTVIDGLAGMFRWIIGFDFFLDLDLDVDMVVSGKGTAPSHVRRRIFIV